jgi:hypothetical protein
MSAASPWQYLFPLWIVSEDTKKILPPVGEQNWSYMSIQNVGQMIKLT